MEDTGYEDISSRLAKSIGQVLIKFMDVLFHAVFPLLEDPYFGVLPFGVRLIFATAFWPTLLYGIHYFIFERDSRAICERCNKTEKRKNTFKDQREPKRTNLGELVWKDVRVEPPQLQNEEDTPVPMEQPQENGENAASSILDIPRFIWHFFRSVYLFCLRCFCLSSETSGEDVPTVLCDTYGNVIGDSIPIPGFLLPLNNTARPLNNTAGPGAQNSKNGVLTRNPTNTKNLKIKFKILGNEMKLTHIADKKATPSLLYPAGARSGNPKKPIKIKYDYRKVKEGEKIYFDGEQLLYSDGKPVLS